MNDALRSPRGARAGERTRTAGGTLTLYLCCGFKKIYRHFVRYLSMRFNCFFVMKLKILRIFSITVIYTLLKICMSDRRHQQGILGCHVTDLTIISGFPEIFRS